MAVRSNTDAQQRTTFYLHLLTSTTSQFPVTLAPGCNFELKMSPTKLQICFCFYLSTGKNILDGVNGTTKTQLTMATARQLRTAEESESVDIKKFSAHTVKDGVAVSAALEAKRILEIDGNSDAKSNRKHQK